MNLQTIQIALFFKDALLDRPDLKFKNFTENFSHIFDKMPTIFPLPKEAPLDVPFMILGSNNNLNTCNISRSRIDLIIMDKSLFNKAEIFNNFIDEVCDVREIKEFGFVTTYFENMDNASEIIKQKFLKNDIEATKDLSIRYNKPININKEQLNYHFIISDINQYNIHNNSMQIGLMMQRDINNISLNIINETFVASKLKSILNDINTTLYSDQLND